MYYNTYMHIYSNKFMIIYDSIIEVSLINFICIGFVHYYVTIRIYTITYLLIRSY